MKTKKPNLIAISATVSVTAAEPASEGMAAKPAKFEATVYTGGAMHVEHWEFPVVIDLAGVETAKVLVANLDHDRTKRVGNFSVANDGKTLVATGTATAATEARDEVVLSAAAGYQWQASVEVTPRAVEEVAANKSTEANGQQFTGPVYVVRKGILKGFAFVSHGADDNTSVTIAASAASHTESEKMKPEIKAWAESMGIDVDNATPEVIATIEANYAGRQSKPAKRPKLDESFDAKRAEIERVDAITEIAVTACDKRPYDIDAIKALAEQAIDGKWTVEKFRLELLEASLPPAHTVFRTRKDDRLNNQIVEAAIAKSGRLEDYEKQFPEQVLDAADKHFPTGISLGQLMILCAEANGYHHRGGQVTLDVQRAAFGMTGATQVRAQQWSSLVISTILSNNANKFLREGWNAIDMTPMRIAAIRPVRDFKTITTVSLTGGLQFEKVGAAGELKHGTLGEVTYSNKADTYGIMLAITREDIINDDLGAISAAPRRIGRGGALKLNDIFWTEFLDNTGSFFTAGNSNVNTGVADMTVGGLAATETIFMDQTDPDGKPLGIQPAILLVPTALKASALTLMSSERLIDGSSTGTQGSTNIWRGRFRVESSPYMSNSAYTGYSAAAWYMLADPSDLPVIEIVALNGRVEPIVETADADFNVLGIQMRGYSDVGVNLQEKRAGVRADGGSS